MSLSQTDKISLISSIYQSGSNIDQFIHDLEKLNKALDYPQSKNSDDFWEEENESVQCQSGFDLKTQKIIDNWTDLVHKNLSDEEDDIYVELYPYQEKFLHQNQFNPNGKSKITNRNFYLGSKGAGLTTLFSIHAARSLLSNPNIEIHYLNSSNDKLEIFVEAVVELLPKEIIQSKSIFTVKLTNGSYLRADTYQNITYRLDKTVTNLDFSNSNSNKLVDKFIEHEGLPEIIIYDNSEDVPFKHIDNLIKYGNECQQFLITGHAKIPHSLPYKIITDPSYQFISKHMIPWWEAGVQHIYNFNIIKQSLTQEQFLSLYCCQFSAPIKSVEKESKKDIAFNRLVGTLFKPTVIDGEPDLEFNWDDLDTLRHQMEFFKQRFLTPWISENKTKKKDQIIADITTGGIEELNDFLDNEFNIQNISPSEMLEQIKSEFGEKSIKKAFLIDLDNVSEEEAVKMINELKDDLLKKKEEK